MRTSNKIICAAGILASLTCLAYAEQGRLAFFGGGTTIIISHAATVQNVDTGQTADGNEDTTAVDMSEKIINATFDTKGDLTGWTLKHNNGSNHAEVKNGVVTGRAYFDLQQTISGLKPGIYKVTAQAFTRPDKTPRYGQAYKTGKLL